MWPNYPFSPNVLVMITLTIDGTAVNFAAIVIAIVIPAMIAALIATVIATVSAAVNATILQRLSAVLAFWGGIVWANVLRYASRDKNTCAYI